MMARRTMLGYSAAAASIMLTGCGLLNSKASYRFRMTVEVETPQGLRVGSSVYEVGAEKNNARLLAEERAGGTVTRGQATLVDLPGGLLFVLLKMPEAGDGLGAVATYALSPETKRGGIDNFLPAVEKLGGWFGGAKAELPREDWPIMVRFRDITDPKSVEVVVPDSINVKRILLETTSDDVTTGITSKLQWLSNGGLTLDPSGGPTLTPTVAQTFYQSEFTTEIER